MPWEADAFYSQQGLIDKNITLDWQPLGTGAFMLEENNPNLRMVMLKNSNYHADFYPQEGELGA
jgi:ABC-type transport system substrate-binding protein